MTHPLVDRDPSLSFELLRRFVVAAVYGGDLVACSFQRLRDCFTNPARTACHDCYACQDSPLLLTMDQPSFKRFVPAYFRLRYRRHRSARSSR